MRYANVWLRCSTAFVAEIQVGTETFALHTIENGWMVEQFRKDTHMIVLFQKENDFGYVIEWLFNFILPRCEAEGIDETKTFEAFGRLIESEHWDRLCERWQRTKANGFCRTGLEKRLWWSLPAPPSNDEGAKDDMPSVSDWLTTLAFFLAVGLMAFASSILFGRFG